MSSVSDNAFSRVLAGLLVLTPIPLGSNRPLAWTALATVLGLLLVVWGQRGGLRGGAALPRAVRWLAAGWLAVVGWALVQAAPWTPAAWHHPLWAEAGLSGAVALDPALATEGAMRLLSYGTAFVLAVALGRDVGIARRLVAAMAVGAGAVALYGLVVHLGGFGTILWWDKWTYHDSLTATFVNRNAAATLFGFGVLAALALVLDRRGWAAAAGGLCAAALLLTQSRAGLGAGLLGGLVLVVAVAAARRPSGRRLRRWVLSGVVVLGVLGAAAGGGVGARLATTDLAATDRAPIHAAVAAGVLERPWTGHGLGSFNRAFAAHRPPDLDQHWDKAHSSYLENAFELGLPVTVLLYTLLGGVAVLTVRGLIVRRRHRVYPALGLATLGLAGVHATVDFTLQMPANALWLAVLTGVGVAQSMPTRAATAASASGRSASARR